MSRPWKARLLAAATIALVALPGFARAEKLRFGLTGFGGYNTYSMSDLNDQIDEVNADPDVASAGIKLDNVTSGFSYGGGLQVWVTPKFAVELDYERVGASTSDEGSVSGVPVSVEARMPADGFVTTLSYFFPSTSKTRFGLGGGLGFYTGDGKIEVSGGGTSIGEGIHGNGVGFHFLGLMDHPISSQLHLGLRAGYRIAKSGALEDDSGIELSKPDGSEVRADWSGLMTRASVTIMLGKSE